MAEWVSQGRHRPEMVSWLPTAQVQQELLESHGPELGHVLELRKPVFQRVLAWTQHLELQMKIPKAKPVPAGISEDLRAWCPEGPCYPERSRGRAKGKALDGLFTH